AGPGGGAGRRGGSASGPGRVRERGATQGRDPQWPGSAAAGGPPGGYALRCPDDAAVADPVRSDRAHAGARDRRHGRDLRAAVQHHAATTAAAESIRALRGSADERWTTRWDRHP